MIAQDQIKDLHTRIVALHDCLAIEDKRKQVSALELQTQAPDFWNDPKSAEAFLKKMNLVKSWVTDYDSAKSAVDDLDVLYEFASESGASEEAETDESKELALAYQITEKKVEAHELQIGRAHV